MKAEISNLVSESHHPNVVTFIGVEDYFEKGMKRVGLVYKFMNGGSLDEALQRRREYLSNKRSDVLMVMRMGLEAARGLRALHEKRIIHRDVACRNLLWRDCLFKTKQHKTKTTITTTTTIKTTKQNKNNNHNNQNNNTNQAIKQCNHQSSIIKNSPWIIQLHSTEDMKQDIWSSTLPTSSLHLESH